MRRTASAPPIQWCGTFATTRNCMPWLSLGEAIFYHFCVALLILCATLPAAADTVILNDGASYAGQFTGATNGRITFVDAQGINYSFPVADVQSLVCTSAADVVTLRNGKVYSGHYTGSDPIQFQDREGIQYEFPLRDVESLVFTRQPQAAAPVSPVDTAKVIPEGTPITIRADETIDSRHSAPGDLFSATVGQDVPDNAGGVAIRAGTPAKLIVRQITTGGVAHSPELVLDLFSVTADGKHYRVVTSDVDMSNRRGLGANRRTGEFVGGGGALGGLLGAILGGGRGAAIGTAAGAGGGLFTEIFTRGKEVKVPAETVMTFRLDRTLVLRPEG